MINRKAVLSTALLGLLSVFQTGCVSWTKPHSPTGSVIRTVFGAPDNPFLRPIPDAPEGYRLAMNSALNGEWTAARDQFVSFLRAEPNSNWVLAAQFHLGWCHEQLGHDALAVETFQFVVQRGLRTPRLKALASIRLATLAEKRGDFIESAARLADARRLESELPEEVRELELPALIGSSRARASDFKQADREFSRSDRYLVKLRARSERFEDQDQNIARILYQMGAGVSDQSVWREYESAIIRFERVQLYLLGAIEIGAEPWASRAMLELQSAIARAEIATGLTALSPSGIAGSSTGDDQNQASEYRAIEDRVDQQRMQWERAALLIGALQRLRSLFIEREINEQGELSQLARLAAAIDAVDERLQARLMLDQPIIQVQTPESLKRQTERGRAWRTVNPLPLFEIEKR